VQSAAADIRQVMVHRGGTAAELESDGTRGRRLGRCRQRHRNERVHLHRFAPLALARLLLPAVPTLALMRRVVAGGEGKC
jgi:hypothetical protein